MTSQETLVARFINGVLIADKRIIVTPITDDAGNYTTESIISVPSYGLNHYRISITAVDDESAYKTDSCVCNHLRKEHRDFSNGNTACFWLSCDCIGYVPDDTENHLGHGPPLDAMGT
jgi:hypothetical protein